MGAWSEEPFGNDEACDWAYSLEEASDWGPVEQALSKITAEDYSDDSEEMVAIAAAEVVALGLGRGTQLEDEYTEPVIEFLKRVSPPSEELVELAREALKEVTGVSSSLAELWDYDEEWLEAVERISAALS